jgi:hypothetical protein
LALPGAGLVLALWVSPALGQVPTETPDAGPPLDAIPVVPAPPASPPATPAVDNVVIQVGVRTLGFVQDPDAPDKLGDVGGKAEADVVVTGSVHPFLKWQAGFAGLLGEPGSTGNSAVLLDLVAKVEIIDALNLWIGRMPVPSDRVSLSTVWSIAPWTLPGRYQAFAVAVPALETPAGPRSGNLVGLDRGDGATLWGQLRGGRVKYYVGAFGLAQPERSPLYSARLAVDFLDPEPGYRTSSSYYGSKDVLALGAGFQHQTQGSKAGPASASDPDFNQANADLLFEIGGEATGVLDLEAAFAKLWGKNEVFGYQTFGLVSYLVPIEIGFGRFQPLVRLQHAGAGELANTTALTGLDAQLGYIVDGHHARLSAGWSYVRGGGQTYNAILLGAQLLSKPTRSR